MGPRRRQISDQRRIVFPLARHPDQLLDIPCEGASTSRPSNNGSGRSLSHIEVNSRRPRSTGYRRYAGPAPRRTTTSPASGPVRAMSASICLSPTPIPTPSMGRPRRCANAGPARPHSTFPTSTTRWSEIWRDCWRVYTSGIAPTTRAASSCGSSRLSLLRVELLDRVPEHHPGHRRRVGVEEAARRV